MTKIKGNAILVHIQNISAASELHQYVLKVLKVSLFTLSRLVILYENLLVVFVERGTKWTFDREFESNHTRETPESIYARTSDKYLQTYL